MSKKQITAVRLLTFPLYSVGQHDYMPDQAISENIITDIDLQEKNLLI